MLRLDDSMRAGGDALIRSLLATQGPHVPEMSPASHISSSTAPAAPAEGVSLVYCCCVKSLAYSRARVLLRCAVPK